jgi:hypothetical protein
MGSIMAQVAHGVCKLLELHRSSTNLSNYLQEVNSMTKVVLSVKNQSQLLKLQEELSEQGIIYLSLREFLFSAAAINTHILIVVSFVSFFYPLSLSLSRAYISIKLWLVHMI